ncbi:MAG: beta-ketoacyl synthase chain length factor [Rubrivivax sp.]|nr:beta-ketoacyl synthase chain length factor [Rubrivivax sp.]
MSRLTLHVTGVGLLGPGLDDWAGGAARLADPATWAPRTTLVPAPARLPATERRRAGPVVKAAVAVADQAVAASGLDPRALATVFTSSSGDPGTCHALCEALALPERLVSPTRFTNSVHNAPAGYWHIATQSMQPSTSLAAFDASFGAGLLEAAVQCTQRAAPLLLVASDQPYPEPLHALRPLPDLFAAALVLWPQAPPAAGWSRCITLQPGAGTVATPCEHAGLEAVRRGIPAARALPLLAALARPGAAEVVIEAAEGWPIRINLDAL